MNPLRFRLSLSALALLALAACTTAPNRPTSDTEVKWLTAAERGDIEGMLELAELYERWNDRRALDWMLRRCSRDLGTLTALFERLDRASLAAQRRLTVPFLRQVLGAEGADSVVP